MALFRTNRPTPDPEPEERTVYAPPVPRREEPVDKPTTAITAERGIRMEKIVHIGQSVEIKGELAGSEDLTIEGKVEGKITLRDHVLTIGPNGRIRGEVFAKSVMVIGEVDGNISAEDKVEVASTGSMKGDISAPRVVLSDGARFKGSIDMERKVQAGGMTVSKSVVNAPHPTVSGAASASPSAPVVKV